MNTTIRTFVLVAFTLSAAVGAVLAVDIWAKKQKAVHGGGFARVFVSNREILPCDTLAVNNSMYFAGSTDHHIYLGSITGPRSIFQLTVPTLDSQRIMFSISDNRKLKVSQIRVVVDSPHFYMGEGTVPIIYKGKLVEKITYPFITNSQFFLSYTPMSDSAFLVTAINKAQERVLGKVYRSGRTVFYNDLLEKQVDGYFCTEGEPVVFGNQVVYVYTYRNHFFVTDSSLTVRQKSHTIDTISRAQIRISRFNNDKSIGLASPPLVVNKNASIYKRRNFLMINSIPIAENEESDRIRKSAVIDVYHLSNKKYHFSFLIPFYNNEKVRDFRVAGHTLAVLYSSAVLTFDLCSLELDKDIMHADQEGKTEHL